jgi:hypothetical protein
LLAACLRSLVLAVSFPAKKDPSLLRAEQANPIGNSHQNWDKVKLSPGRLQPQATWTRTVPGRGKARRVAFAQESSHRTKKPHDGEASLFPVVFSAAPATPPASGLRLGSIHQPRPFSPGNNLKDHAAVCRAPRQGERPCAAPDHARTFRLVLCCLLYGAAV